MASRLLTDVELRARWSCHREKTYSVEEGTILTPSARDFLHEHGIELRFIPRPGASPAGKEVPARTAMSRTPIPVRDGKACYIDAATGEELHEKPEEMTHLRGNLLVPKTHPQIAFRGKLDTLMAQFLHTEALAAEKGEEGVLSDLEELLAYVRSILAAEVKDEPLGEMRLLGLDSAGIRHTSHFVKQAFGIDHPIPDYRMGMLCMELNFLRTQVRETELFAARAFETADHSCSRKDIIEGLNRLSSCIYIIFCRKLSGFYDREANP